MISFIVPAHNEEQLLGQTLEALHAAARSTGTPYELIVVDDASTDRTADIAAASGARLIPVRHRQIARARNADRTYVICIDTDPAHTTDEGGCWWEVAVPEVSDRAEVRKAREAYVEGRKKQS